MIEAMGALPTHPLVTGIIAIGAVVLALATIWMKALKPAGRWVGEMVALFRELVDLLRQMKDFLTQERDAILSRITNIERDHEAEQEVHDELVRAKTYAMQELANVAGKQEVIEERVRKIERRGVS